MNIYIILLTSYNIGNDNDKNEFVFRFSFLKMMMSREEKSSEKKAQPCEYCKAGRVAKDKGQEDCS